MVMAHPLSPDHAADVLEIESAQLELAPAVPELTPLHSDHDPDFSNGNPNEGLKEDPEEEPKEEEPKEEPEEMDMDMEEDSKDEIDGPELIFPYEVVGSPNLPPSESDTSSDSEPEDDIAATVGTLTQVPLIGHKFPGSIHVKGGSSSTTPITYHPEDLMSTREAAKTLAQSRDRESHRHMDLLDSDLGVVEHNNDKIENVVVTLDERVQRLDQYGFREDNQRLKKELKSAKLSATLVQMDKDQVERDFYELRVWMIDLTRR
ncbi:hypothetical protein Tco_0591259 [Tanacetum coccineum]